MEKMRGKHSTLYPEKEIPRKSEYFFSRMKVSMRWDVYRNQLLCLLCPGLTKNICFFILLLPGSFVCLCVFTDLFKLKRFP